MNTKKIIIVNDYLDDGKTIIAKVELYYTADSFYGIALVMVSGGRYEIWHYCESSKLEKGWVTIELKERADKDTFMRYKNLFSSKIRLPKY